jgi:hypothetical protein
MPIPLNEEPDDLKLVDALEAIYLARLREAWPSAVEKSRTIMANSSGKTKDAVLAEVAPCWAEVKSVLHDIEHYYLDILHQRVKLRMDGVLPGDPREADLFPQKLHLDKSKDED